MAFLERELDAMADLPPELLLHDYGSLDNHPFYFDDFIANANLSGLAFLANADPWELGLTPQPPAVTAALDRLPNRVAREQYLDLIYDVRFRRTLLCRQDAHPADAVIASRAATLHFYSVQSPPLGLADALDDLPLQLGLPERPPLSITTPARSAALRQRPARTDRRSPPSTPAQIV